MPTRGGDGPSAAPDAFDRLWTPHRMAYIRGESKPADDSDGGVPVLPDPGAARRGGPGRRAAGELAFAVLNLHPYSPGHLMVCRYRHVADYADLTPDEAAEMAALTQQAIRALREVSRRRTASTSGMNQGGVAGAGIAAHLHQHVVPRWSGDANFMPIIGAHQDPARSCSPTPGSCSRTPGAQPAQTGVGRVCGGSAVPGRRRIAGFTT